MYIVVSDDDSMSTSMGLRGFVVAAVRLLIEIDDKFQLGVGWNCWLQNCY
jgi:hypothetical protein